MLLDIARRIVEEEGESALTLGVVADEAGLARATIYGYFSGKRDLLAALESHDSSAQAELALLPPQPSVPEAVEPDEHAIPTWMDYQPELAGFAADADVLQAVEVVEPEAVAPAEVELPAERDEVEQPLSEVPATADVAQLAPTREEIVDSAAYMDALVHDDVPDAVQDTAAPVAATDEVQDTESALLTPYEQDRRLQAVHLEEIAKRLILPESALKEGTDAVISRLETRMRVLERSIAGLETRQQVVPDETAKKIKPISDLVSQLQSRADSIEDRQRQALAELRLSIHELTARGTAPGATQYDSAAVMPSWPDVQTEFAQNKSEGATASEAPAETSEGEAEDDNPRNAYLSVARNMAKEGARQAAERESLYEEEQRARRRRLLTAAGVAGLCLVAVGVMFALRPGAHGVSVAQSKAVASVTAARRPVDPRGPLDRLTALANKGDTRAELLIGLKYLKGDGIAANDAAAAHWFEQAARAGYPVAQNRLGALYQAGRGLPADLPQAMHWYEAAAQQGDRHAMSNLAVLYAGGNGVPANLAEAARWFERSANLGYVDAQFNLAVLFERGDGVPQSLLDAYKWYSIAAAAGDPVAKTRAAAIATQVSPEELQAAQQAAANFKPQPMNVAANDVPALMDVLASAR
jgi:TPR repeat protein